MNNLFYFLIPKCTTGYIYLNPAKTGLELYQGIKEFITRYNKRKHQGIKNQKPKDLFKFEYTNHLSVA